MYYRFKQLILILGDEACLLIGFVLGVTERYLTWPGMAITPLLPPMLKLFLIVPLLQFIIGLYDIGKLKNNWIFYQKMLLGALTWMGFAVLYFYINPTLSVTPKTTLLLTALNGFGLVALWRFLYNRFLSTTLLRTRVVFAGQVQEAEELATTLAAEPEHGYEVLGFIGAESKNTTQFPSAASLATLLPTSFPDIIVLSPSVAGNQALSKELYQALFKQVSIVSLAEFYELIFRRIPPFTFSENWFVTNFKEQSRKMYDRLRILIDYGVAFLMAAVFAITFPFIALATKLTSRGPIFFKQERVGKLGQPFTIYKFRTMQALTKEGSAELAGPAFAAIGDTRVTAVGRFLRRTRLDELPQWINIAKGEMGIIGPRPERPAFVETLTQAVPFYTLRHLIKPGLTGWAQLQQSYYGSIKENLFKLEYDLFYIKNRSFFFDLAILLRTIQVILRMMGR